MGKGVLLGYNGAPSGRGVSSGYRHPPSSRRSSAPEFQRSPFYQPEPVSRAKALAGRSFRRYVISTSFESLGLLPELLRAVTEQGYTEPTPIQSQAIPVVLSGRDLLGAAQTGTGKTAGFALPILQRLAEHPGKGPVRCLILT